MLGRENRVLLALAIVGAVSVLLSVSAFDWMEWTCRLPPGNDDKPFGLGPEACFEFWANRYQALIGAVVAVAAATAAWLGVMKQVAEAQKQVNEARLQVDEMRKQTVLAHQDSAAVRCDQLGEIIFDLKGLKERLDNLHVRHRSARLLQYRIAREPRRNDYTEVMTSHLREFCKECSEMNQLLNEVESIREGVFPKTIFEHSRWEDPFLIFCHETRWILQRGEKMRNLLNEIQFISYENIRSKLKIALTPGIADIEGIVDCLSGFVSFRLGTLQRRYDEAAETVIGPISRGLGDDFDHAALQKFEPVASLFGR